MIQTSLQSALFIRYKLNVILKYTNLKSFQKHLESAAPTHLSSVYLVMSKESFESKTAIASIADQVLAGLVKNGENLCFFNADEVDGKEILEELQAFSFLAPKRVIVIAQAEKLSKVYQDRLRAYISNPNKAVCLVLEAATLNRATGFYKDAEKYGVILDVPEEKPWEKEKSLQAWVIELLRKEGKEIDLPTVSKLVKLLGVDQSTLYQELEKLICYVGDRKTITLADISSVCVKITQENVWQLSEAIFRRDPAEALRMTKNILDEGTPLILLLRQIRSQLQTDYQVCCMLECGKTPQDISAQFPYMRGVVLNKHLQQAQAYGMQRFKSGLLAVDETELLAKNSSGEPEWLAERLIFKLVAK